MYISSQLERGYNRSTIQRNLTEDLLIVDFMYALAYEMHDQGLVDLHDITTRHDTIFYIS